MTKVRINRLHSNPSIPEQTSLFSQDKAQFSGNDPEIKTQRTLKPTSRENATLEAEKGETVVTNLQGEGIPEFYRVGGKPHSRGGTPLNLPASSFIFSKDKKLKIGDSDALEMFGKAKGNKKSYTPAELSLQYDLNKYREILLNPFSSKMERETAEMMISNYNLKLGALALTQEAQKGFDRGIPAIAQPYMEKMGITAEDLLMAGAPGEEQLQQFKHGGSVLPRFKDGGPKKGSKKIRITKLPQYNQAGQAPTGRPAPRRRQILPEDAYRWDPTLEGYDESQVKPGHYVRQDGTWKKVTGYQPREYTGDFVDEEGILGDFNRDYGLILERFKDPAFRKGFLDNYTKSIKNAKPNSKTGLTQAHIDEAAMMSDDDIIETFLTKTKSNLAVANKYEHLGKHDRKDLWDSNPNLAQEAAMELGFDKMDTPAITAFQAAYVGLNNMSKQKDYKPMFKDFKLAQVGKADDKVTGIGEGTISGIDGWDGNTTSGETLLAKDNEMILEDAEWTEEKPEKEYKHLPDQQPQKRADFWTEDKSNLFHSALDYLTAKKYDPWIQRPEGRDATPLFQDFRNAAYALQSGVKGAMDKAAAVGDAKQVAAMMANAVKAMAPGVANLQAQEAKTNLGIANKFEMFNKAQRDQRANKRAALATELYDRNIRVEDKFDQTKRALRHNMKNMFNNMWTNRGKTQAMNIRDEAFDVDPRTGFVYRTGVDTPIIPQTKKAQDFYQTVSDIKAGNPDMDWREATAIAKGGVDDRPATFTPESWQYDGATYPQNRGRGRKRTK